MYSHVLPLSTKRPSPTTTTTGTGTSIAGTPTRHKRQKKNVALSPWIQSLFPSLREEQEQEEAEAKDPPAIEKVLDGVVCLVHGTMLSLPRAQFSNLLIQHGASVVTSMSSSVTHLICADVRKFTRKTDHFAKRNFHIVDERWLRSLLPPGSWTMEDQEEEDRKRVTSTSLSPSSPWYSSQSSSSKNVQFHNTSSSSSTLLLSNLHVNHTHKQKIHTGGIDSPISPIQLVQKVNKYQSRRDKTRIFGWKMCEHLHGVQVIFNGFTRQLFNVAGEVLEEVPIEFFVGAGCWNIVLDGIMTTRTQNKQVMQKLLNGRTKCCRQWSTWCDEGVKFTIYDAPLVKGNLRKRLSYIGKVLRSSSSSSSGSSSSGSSSSSSSSSSSTLETTAVAAQHHGNDDNNNDDVFDVFDEGTEPGEEPIALIERTVVTSEEQMYRYLGEEMKETKNGLLLMNPMMSYVQGPNDNHVLCVKYFQEDTAVVQAFKMGKAKNLCIIVQNPVTGLQFKIWKGIAPKKNGFVKPNIGATIMFRYSELTKKQLPKNPVFQSIVQKTMPTLERSSRRDSRDSSTSTSSTISTLSSSSFVKSSSSSSTSSSFSVPITIDEMLATKKDLQLQENENNENHQIINCFEIGSFSEMIGH